MLGLFAIVCVVTTAIVKPDSLLYLIGGFMSLLMAPYAIIIVALMISMAVLVLLATGVFLWEVVRKISAYFSRNPWE